MKKYPLQEYVSDAILAWLFSFSLLWTAFQSLQYTFSAGLAALYLLGFTLLWILILRVKWAALALGAVFFLLVLYWELTMPFDSEGTQAILAEWNQYGLWVLRALTSNIPGPQDYLDRSLTLMCLGTALLSGLMVRVKIHPVVFLLLGGGLFFVQELFLNVVFYPAFFLFLCALALYTVRQPHRNRRRRAQKAVPPSRALAGILPLCLLAVALSLLLPSSDTALGQPILDWLSVGGDVEPQNLSYFSFGGLKKRDGNDELGGPLRQNDTLLLRIRAEHPSYLRAHTYDTYTGRAWATSMVDAPPITVVPMPRTDSHVDLPNELLVNVSLPYFYPGYGTLAGGYQTLTGAILRTHAETASGDLIQTPALKKLFVVQSYSQDGGASGEFPEIRHLYAPQNAVRYNRQQITFVDLRTTALYLPLNAVDVTPGAAPDGTRPGNIVLSPQGDMRMNLTMGKDYSYGVEVCELNLNRRELGELLRLSGAYLLDGVQKEVSNMPGTSDSVYTLTSEGFLAGIRDYAAWEREQALWNTPYNAPLLPDTVPERVYDLAHSLTDSEPTDYDKALAIETYLRNSFPYDTEVPATPPGREFVDWFLFDLQRGYCTYYATAMTVLCRAVGLPARYVEGFVPAAEGSTPGNYRVTGEQAHAWCEVYFTGFGWVTFDPTASLGAAFETQTQPREAPPPEAVTPTPDRPSGTPWPSYRPSGAPNTPEGRTPPIGLLILLTAVLLLIAVPAGQTFRRKRVSRRSPSRAAETLWKRAILLARLRGVSKPAPSETPLEWAGRTDESLGERTGVALLPLAQLYSRLRYGPGQAQSTDAAELYRMYEGIVRRWRLGINPFKYFVYRYYLGRL